LKRFDVHDQDLFFGRNQLIENLLQEIKQTNLILLLGASGSGKSSLVRAGLIPQLRKKWGAQLVNITFTPDIDPFEKFYASLLSQYSSEEASLAREAKNTTLVEVVDKLKKSDTYWLIFIDQFEELFTRSELLKQKLFIQSLVKINNSKQSDVKIIAAMRSDFLDRLNPYAEFIRATDKYRPFIAEMEVDELRLAIEQPAAHHGVVYESGLVDEIIKDVQGQAGYLPLLQYTLDLLWKTEVKTGSINDRTLNISTYRSIGGARGALQQHVDTVYNNLGKEEKEIAQTIFLKLVNIERDNTETTWKPVRRRAERSELKSEVETKVLVQLIDENLLVSDRLPNSQESTIEISHEMLLTCWRTLKEWIEDNNQAIELRSRLNDDVARWKSTKTEDELWSGTKLLRILELQDNEIFNKTLGGFSDDTKIFIRASKTKKVKAEKKLRNSRRLMTVLLTITSVAALLIIRSQINEYNQLKIIKSRELATNSKNNLTVDTTRSLLLAIQAQIYKDTPQANHALWQAFKENHELFHLDHDGQKLSYAEFDSNNTSRVLTLGDDGTAKLWTLTEIDKQPRVFSHNDKVSYGSFDPSNPNRILTVSYDGTAKIWDVNNSSFPLTVINDGSKSLFYGKFNPKNQNQILIISGNACRFWDISNPKSPIVIGEIKAEQGEEWKGLSDPFDFNRIMIFTNTGKAKIWNLKQPKKIISLKVNQGSIFSGAFDISNPKRFLTFGDDNKIRLWNLDNPNQPILLEGHDGRVLYGIFNPYDSNQVLTTSEDKTARIWDINKRKEIKQLKGHVDAVTHAIFNPENSNQVLTSSKDGTAKIWDIEKSIPTFTLRGHSDRINYAAFDLNNAQQLLTLSDDNTVKVWSLKDRDRITLKPNSSGIVGAFFDSVNKSEVTILDRTGIIQNYSIINSIPVKNKKSQIGEIKYFYKNGVNGIIAIVRPDSKSVEIYDSKMSKLIKRLHILEDNVRNIAFDKNNNLILIVAGKVARIIDINSNETIKKIQAKHLLSAANFDPNNSSRIALGDDFGLVQIWSIEKEKPEYELTNRQNKAIYHVKFNPNNSNQILVLDDDKLVRIHNIEKDEIQVLLSGHQDRVVYGEFDPKNPDRILTVSDDGTARVWNLKDRGNPLILSGDGTKVTYGSFDLENPNRVITINESGFANIFTVSGNDLLSLSWNTSSRCLAIEEVKDNNLTENKETLYSLSEYLSLKQSRYRSNCNQSKKSYDQKQNKQ
jgi:WD40 repeat protein/energy-coupling factor transporter ATP-binding protein EcfA2